MDYSIRSLAVIDTYNNPINKSLYTIGDDRRRNLYEVNDVGIRGKASSVACIVTQQLTEEQGRLKFSESITLSKRIKRRFNGIKFGEYENFRKEPTPIGNVSTIFLVGRKLMLTAAHCVGSGGEVSQPPYELMPEEQLKKIKIIFGFHMIDKDRCRDTFEKDDVYEIKKIVAFRHVRSKDCRVDWALVKLDRDVVARKPLQLNFNEKVAKYAQLFMLGHPTGLPLKVAHDAEVKNEGIEHYDANLDAFAGNSGSPVFLEKTQEVVGILFCGNVDYEKTNDYRRKGLVRSYAEYIPQSTINASRYEQCQRTSTLNFVKFYLQVKEDKENHRNSNPVILNYLAQCYLRGCEGVKKDEKKALILYERSAAQGNEEALLWLGMYYYCYCHLLDNYYTDSTKAKANGVSYDEYKAYLSHAFNQRKYAFKYFQKAVELESKRSLLYLGLCYRYGLGVLKDYTKAVEYYTQAFKSGDMDSVFYLCYCYENGKGVKKDSLIAFNFCKKAVERRGNASDLYNLGFCYEWGYTDNYGDIVNKNANMAIKYYQLAVDKGSIVAIEALERAKKNNECVII